MRETIAIPPASEEQRVLFSLRMVKYFLCWLLLWQGGMVSGSPIQIQEYIQLPTGMTTMEALAVLLFFTVLIERTLMLDFTIRRSYFTGPLVLIVLAFFISWARGCYINQRVRFILEFHEMIELPFLFLVISSAFRDETDRAMLWKLLFFAVIGKAFDGTFIYFFSNAPGRFWGVVQSWRDGYLLGIGVIGFLLLFHYRGNSMKSVKRWMIVTLPVLALTFVMSFRRTFFVGAFVCMMAMFVTLPREKRKLHLFLVLAIIAGFLITAILTNPLEVATRMSGITAPQNEGSAYIRLMELPNVLENIRRHPIWGVPAGVPWTTYYRMPISADYTTLGTHNSYLYWPLRAGILGSITFIWFICKFWKTALINYRLRKSEEDFLFGQWSIQILIMYQVACFFGLMYADMMSGLLAVLLTVFQLQTKHVTGRSSLREVALWPTMRAGKLIYREPLLKRLRALFLRPAFVSK
jgi:O-antigen ligase